MEFVAAIVTWVVPPVSGAVIGYVTNAIAIRMLFRPLTEKRILGLRLPLTPGIIPRERYDLAESMARMVSTELLTEEAVRKQIHEAAFEESVAGSITSITSELLDTPLGTVGASLLRNGEAAPASQGLLGSLGALVGSLFGAFTKSAGFATLMRDLIRHFVQELAERPVASVLGANGSVDGLVARMLDGLTSEQGRAEVKERMGGWVRRQFEANRSLMEFVSEQDVEAIARFVDSLYPSVVKFFVNWLRSEGTKRELTIRGRFLVQDIVDRLNGIQRFIITAANYKRTLDENMDGIIADALDSIEDAGMDPDTRRRLVEVVRKELASARMRGLSDLAEKHREAVERAAGTLAERALAVASLPEFRGELLHALSGGGEGGSQTVGALLDRLFGLSGRDPGDFLAELILPAAGGADGAGRSTAVETPLQGEASEGSLVAGALGRFVGGFVESHREMRIRELFGMDEAAKLSFDRALAASLIATIDARVPEILASINIHDLVVSKINGLNVEEVEKLLLQVIAKHLRWINIFGGLLGALIGFVQDALRLLNLG